MTEQNKIIKEELEAHIADKAEDLIASGMDYDKAWQKARVEFGDIKKISSEVEAIDKGNLFLNIYPYVIYIYLILTFLMSTSFLIFRKEFAGTDFEPFLLYWIMAGVISSILIFIHWINEYFGLNKKSTFIMAMTFTALVNIAMTVILDIDNFEVNIHSIFLGVLLIITGYFGWNYFSLNLKRIFIYGYAVLATLSIFNEEPLFSFIGTARCLFLTPDNLPFTETLNNCEQVSFFSGMLLPIYITLFVGIPYFIYFLIKYWKSKGSKIYRKVIMTSTAISCLIVPTIFNDINNYNQISVIPWKAEIYDVYQEVLGRDPEEKDIKFYAITRAFEDINKVRQTLHTSMERKAKINMIFVEVLNREAQEEEIEFYLKQRISVEEIYSKLRNQN